MSRLYRPQSVSRLGVALFKAAGAGAHEALATVQSLVTSSLMGHDSHGVIRIPEYLGFVATGRLLSTHRSPWNARARPRRSWTVSTALVLSVPRRPFAKESRSRATTRTACVITRRCNHVGRLGAWVQLAADEGMLALATCHSPVHGHEVLPWGGRDGRLGTNPIAYAVPTGGDPLVADFATSVAPEGKIRFSRNEGKNRTRRLDP